MNALSPVLFLFAGAPEGRPAMKARILPLFPVCLAHEVNLTSNDAHKTLKLTSSAFCCRSGITAPPS